MTMWRNETGFLEMFMSYYLQFEQNAATATDYRNFLFDLLSLHESVHGEPNNTGTSLVDTSLDMSERVDRVSDVSYSETPPPPSAPKDTDTNTSQLTMVVKKKSAGQKILPAKKRKRVATARFVADMSSPTFTVVMEDSSMEASKASSVLPLEMKTSTREESAPSTLNVTNSPQPTIGNQQDNTDSSPVKEPEVERRRFFCVYCDNAFETVEELQEHSKIHRGDRPFFCVKCPKSFKTKNGLRLHDRLHTGERPYACHFCEKNFVSLGTLQRHESSEHKHPSVHVCVLCDKRFKSAVNLSKHEALHRGERPFKCQYCPQTFTQRCYKKVHERLHTGDYPYKCDQCPKKFNNKSHCVAHMRVHSGEYPFSCPICNKGFRTSWTFKAHNCRGILKKIKLEVDNSNVDEQQEGVNERMSVSATTPSFGLGDAEFELCESGNRSLATNQAQTSDSKSGILVNVPNKSVSFNSDDDFKCPDVAAVTALQSSSTEVLTIPVSTYHLDVMPNERFVDALEPAASVTAPQSSVKDINYRAPSVTVVPPFSTGVATNVLPQPVENSPVISSIFSEGQSSAIRGRGISILGRGRSRTKYVPPSKRPPVTIAPKPKAPKSSVPKIYVIQNPNKRRDS